MCTTPLYLIIFLFKSYIFHILVLSKIEEAFYESKFRVNGNKVLKKSKEVNLYYVCNKIEIILS